MLLVSKGRSRGVQVFRVPASGWTRKAVTAEALGRLALAPGRGVRGLVTDAAVSPDGAEIAVRTYVEIFFFRLTPKDTLDPLGTACDVTGLELQGEGVAWLPDDTFLLTSEGGFGVPGTLTLVRCPGAQVRMPLNIAALPRALRVSQWIKNLLVFVPIVVDHHLLDPPLFIASCTAFVAFCLAASGAYVLNDLLDLQADRAHPHKRRRPFATGELEPGMAGSCSPS